MKKLINRHTNQSIVEFEGQHTVIHNKFLEREMRDIGILIPPGLRGIYHGKDYVRLNDEDFQKAFKEIYYLTSMNPDTFKWLN